MQLFRLREAIYEKCKVAYSRQQEPDVAVGFSTGGAATRSASAKIPELAKLTRWPVTISYFEQQDATAERAGEQTPVYSISFELYENGISRALVLDYTDFTIKGEMTSLDIKKPKPCP